MAVSYGGQAVLEGVMMRSPSSWAVAIRTPEGDITEVVRDITSPMQRRKVWRLPVIRGVVALGESLAHLHALWCEGRLARIDDGGVWRFKEAYRTYQDMAFNGIATYYVWAPLVAR